MPSLVKFVLYWGLAKGVLTRARDNIVILQFLAHFCFVSSLQYHIFLHACDSSKLFLTFNKVLLKDIKMLFSKHNYNCRSSHA